MRKNLLTVLFLQIAVFCLLCSQANSAFYYQLCNSTTFGSSCSSGCCYKISSSSTTSFCSVSATDCFNSTNTLDAIDAVIGVGTGVTIGIAVGSVACFVITIVAIVCIVRTVNKRKAEQAALQAALQQHQQNQNSTSIGIGYPQNTIVPVFNPVPIYPQNMGIVQPPNYGMDSSYVINQNANNHDASWNPNA